jgi:hypothetical protein
MRSVVHVPRTKLARWILVAAVVAALPGLAACSAGGQANASTFSTATISLTLNSPTGEVQFTDLSMDDMKPGADIYAALTVGNAGTSDFKYSMSTEQSGDADLADALTIGIAAISDGSCTASTYQGGTSVYTDTAGLSKAAITGRALAAGHTERLCFHAQLPSDAGGSLASETADATFNFTALQS